MSCAAIGSNTPECDFPVTAGISLHRRISSLSTFLRIALATSAEYSLRLRTPAQFACARAALSCFAADNKRRRNCAMEES